MFQPPSSVDYGRELAKALAKELGREGVLVLLAAD
jgi:hypothetical protein